MSRIDHNQQNIASKPTERSGPHRGPPRPYGKTLAEIPRGSHRKLRLAMETWHGHKLLTIVAWELFDGVQWVPRRGQCLAFTAAELEELHVIIGDLLASGRVEQ